MEGRCIAGTVYMSLLLQLAIVICQLTTQLNLGISHNLNRPVMPQVGNGTGPRPFTYWHLLQPARKCVTPTSRRLDLT